LISRGVPSGGVTAVTTLCCVIPPCSRFLAAVPYIRCPATTSAGVGPASSPHHPRGSLPSSASLPPSPSQWLPLPPSQGLPLPSPLAVPPSLFIPLCPFVMPHTFPCDFLSTSSTFLLLLYFCTFSPRHQSVRSIPELKSNRSHFATQLLRSYPFALFEGICAPLRPLIPCCPTTTAPVALSRLSSPCPPLIFLFPHYCSIPALMAVLFLAPLARVSGIRPDGGAKTVAALFPRIS